MYISLGARLYHSRYTCRDDEWTTPPWKRVKRAGDLSLSFVPHLLSSNPSTQLLYIILPEGQLASLPHQPRFAYYLLSFPHAAQPSFPLASHSATSCAYLKQDLKVVLKDASTILMVFAALCNSLSLLASNPTWFSQVMYFTNNRDYCERTTALHTLPYLALKSGDP